MAGYVLDTSAVVAVLLREEGAARVEELMTSRETVAVPFAALMEVEYKLVRSVPDRAELELLRVEHWPVEIVESDPSWRHEAALLKARGRLSYADAWVASLALLRDAELVHKDPEFDAVPGLKALRLPYDRPTGRRARG